MLSSHQIRQTFLDFYATRDHTIVQGYPITPPEVASANIWTAPFQPLSLGFRQAQPLRNLTTTQRHFSRNLKVTTERHPHYYEMLSSCSYISKQDAILWIWKLITEIFKIDCDRLFISINPQDQESYDIWRDRVGITASHLIQSKWNFWRPQGKGHGGDTCRIHYDFRRGSDQIHADLSQGGNSERILNSVAQEDDFVFIPAQSGPSHLCDYQTAYQTYLLVDEHVRFLNFCTLVFQSKNYERSSPTALTQNYIETGIELERVTQIIQQKSNPYETDLFFPIISAIEQVAAVRYYGDAPAVTQATIEQERTTKISFQVIADHIRLLVNFVADNLYPGDPEKPDLAPNIDTWKGKTTGVSPVQEFTARLLLHSQLLGISHPLMPEIAKKVIEITGAGYPEIKSKSVPILEVLQHEESIFLSKLNDFETQNNVTALDIDGLIKTYGLPLALLETWANHQQLKFDKEAYLAWHRAQQSAVAE
jgi:alanyl-tRNA synthetase